MRCSRTASICTSCRNKVTHLTSDSSEDVNLHPSIWGHSQFIILDLTTLQPVHILLHNTSLSMAGCFCIHVWHTDSILDSCEKLTACMLIQDGLQGGSLS
jgi:hypothetical protein